MFCQSLIFPCYREIIQTSGAEKIDKEEEVDNAGNVKVVRGEWNKKRGIKAISTR